eukprot:5761512-Prymnesium_polylepis.1
MRARHASALLDHALALRGLLGRNWCAAQPPHPDPSRPCPGARAIWPWILDPSPGKCGGLAECSFGRELLCQDAVLHELTMLAARVGGHSTHSGSAHWLDSGQ